MTKRGHPRRGSLQYWPRKRASRIYPRINWNGIGSERAAPLGFAAWKAGMTHITFIDNNSKSSTYGKLISKPVTVLDSPSLFVCGIRFYKKTHNGYVSIGEKWIDKVAKDVKLKLGKNSKDGFAEGADDVRLIVATQPAKSGMKKTKSDVFELGIGSDDRGKKKEYAESVLGKELNVKDIFRPGDYIDVSAVTKGHGFTGPVKRFGIRIQTRKDKQMHRHVGSIGPTTPRKMDWRVPAAGQHGFHTRTEFSKRIILIDDDSKKVTPKGGFLGYGVVPQSFIVVEGSIPGSRKRLVILRKGFRTQKFEPIEIKSISLESKQGV